MTPRQREQISRLQRDILQLNRALQREADELSTLFESTAADDADFASEEIDRLVRLNDPLEALEIDVTLQFMLREDDPGYEDDSDNVLTERRFPMKGFDSDQRLDGDWREHGLRFLGRRIRVAHCWLFHDREHSDGIEQPALSLHNCLCIDKIWVRVAVDHQATLDPETGDWEAPEAL